MFKSKHGVLHSRGIRKKEWQKVDNYDEEKRVPEDVEQKSYVRYLRRGNAPDVRRRLG